MYKFFNEGVKKTGSSYPLRSKRPINICPELTKWDEEDYELSDLEDDVPSEMPKEVENKVTSSNDQDRKLERSAIVYRTSFCDFKIVTYR